MPNRGPLTGRLSEEQWRRLRAMVEYLDSIGRRWSLSWDSQDVPRLKENGTERVYVMGDREGVPIVSAEVK